MKIFEVLAYGGQTTLIGLFIVFLVLAVLILCIYGMSYVMNKILGIGKSKEKAAAPAPAPVAAPVPAPAPAPVEEVAAPAKEIVEEAEEYVADPQVIAAIAAALAAYGANTKLVIRSVKRASGWKKSARDEAVCRF